MANNDRTVQPDLQRFLAKRMGATTHAIDSSHVPMLTPPRPPLAQGLALERNLFLKLCITEPALARMRTYEEENITSQSPSIEVAAGSVNHD